jgi:geranylgeranyl pyrophosphate synthase
MARLVQKIRESSCTKKAMVEADKHIDNALACLEGLEPSAERDALEQLAKYTVDRKI